MPATAAPRGRHAPPPREPRKRPAWLRPPSWWPGWTDERVIWGYTTACLVAFVVHGWGSTVSAFGIAVITVPAYIGVFYLLHVNDNRKAGMTTTTWACPRCSREFTATGSDPDVAVAIAAVRTHHEEGHEAAARARREPSTDTMSAIRAARPVPYRRGDAGEL